MIVKRAKNYQLVTTNYQLLFKKIKMSKSIILEKSVKFALRIVKLYKYLTEEKKEYVLSKQVLLSGTQIGKHAKEATQAESKQVFRQEMGVALRKASETEYWLLIVFQGKFIDENEYNSINNDCVELIKMLVSANKTIKTNG
jgi:four helix bundle protein